MAWKPHRKIVDNCMVCSKCKINKSIDCYTKDKGQLTGLRPECKDCRYIYAKQYNKRTMKRQVLKRREKIQNNLEYKLGHNIRARFKQAFKKGHSSGRAVANLGCSVPELKQWLESQFYPHPTTGEMMTWNNYGKRGWHIDHIVPLSKFDLNDPKQIKKACHWFNLQPLWAKENESKGSKTIVISRS